MAEFTIVGTGLAGTLFACYLGKAGHSVTLYERRSDPRLGGKLEGRSINLALSVRGLHALTEVGLVDEVVANSVLMRGRMIHPKSGPLVFQRYGKDDSEALHSVSRGGLNRLLVEAAAKYSTVRMQFDYRCTNADMQDGSVEFETPGGVRRFKCDCVVGADGAFSAVRGSMQKLDRFNFSQDYLDHGYKELTIPAKPGGGYQMERNALHIWPRGNYMMIALPNLDGSFTCTLFWPHEGDHGFTRLKTEHQVVSYFKEEFPDAVPLMPELGTMYLANPVGSLVTVRCRPWHVGEQAVLIGDASHAVVPFLGQGMNAAFEDCTVLAECLARTEKRSEAFADYESRRKPHADVLADLCFENFIEMRDRVGSKWFLFKKSWQNFLHKLFPKWYLPLYTMVEFSRIPYGEALARAKRQNTIVNFGLLAILAIVAGLLIGWMK